MPPRMMGGRRRCAKIAGLIAAALCANVAPVAAFRLAALSPCAGFSATAAVGSPRARSRQFAPRCGLPALPLTSSAISIKLVAAARATAAPIHPPPPAWLSFGRWQLLLGQELAGAAGDQPLSFAHGRSTRIPPPPAITMQTFSCGAVHICRPLLLRSPRLAAS